MLAEAGALLNHRFIIQSFSYAGTDWLIKQALTFSPVAYNNAQVLG